MAGDLKSDPWSQHLIQIFPLSLNEHRISFSKYLSYTGSLGEKEGNAEQWNVPWQALLSGPIAADRRTPQAPGI